MSAMNKVELFPTETRDVFTTKEGSEPLYIRTRDKGEYQYWHQSWYGYLSESRVVIKGTTHDR